MRRLESGRPSSLQSDPMRIIREAIFVAVVLWFLVTAVFSVGINLSALGQPAPGFSLVGASRDVSDILPAAQEAGLLDNDHLLELNGTSLGTKSDPDLLVRREFGEVNRLLVERGGRTVAIDIPVTSYGLRDFFLPKGLGLLVGLVYVIFGSAVYRLRPREPASWPFFLFAAAIAFALLNTGNRFVRSTLDSSLSFAGLCLIAPTSLHFTLNLAGPGFVGRLRRPLLALLYGAAPLLLLLHTTAVSGLRPTYHQMVHLAVSMSVALGVVLGLAFLGWIAYRSAYTHLRYRARILLLGIVLAFIVPTANLLFYALNGTQLAPAWLLFSLIALYPCIVTYAMVRHRLFDFDVVLRKGLTYGLLSGVLTVVYAVGIATINAGFAGRVSEGATGGARFFAYFLFSVLLVIFLDRMRETLQAVVDRLFFRRRLDYRRALRQASQAMTSRLRQGEILDSALATIRDAMAVEWGAMFLGNGGRLELHPAASFGEQNAPEGATIETQNPLVGALASSRRGLSRYDPQVLDDPALAESFAAAEAAVAIPLVVEERLLGLLLLGEKRSGDVYGAEDLELLETLANQTGIALMNALAVETIERLNLSLEQKVRERTAELERANDDLARSEADTRSAFDELTRAQARLVQAEKMAALGALVAGVAHEINTPIGAVAASNDVIRRSVEHLRGAKTPKELERPLGVIEDLTRTNAASCQRIGSIVRNLQSFARLDEAEQKVVDIHEGIESTLSLLTYLTASRIRVVRQYGTLPPISCDPGQLNQVFMNLITNACQSIEGDGVITITTELKEAEALIRVADNGRGIAAEDLPRIFDPGFTTKRGIGVGLGLGLSISQNVVSAHGGTIEVESKVGIGSTFSILLPLGPQGTERRIAGHQPPMASGQRGPLGRMIART